jgi:hypothetical protein
MPAISFGKKAGKLTEKKRSSTGTKGALVAAPKAVGRPAGSTVKNANPYREILLMHLKKECPVSGVMEGRAVIEHVICAQIAAALDGNVVAQNSIMDRMFGKVTDKVELSGDAQNPLSILQQIEMVIVKPSQRLLDNNALEAEYEAT